MQKEEEMLQKKMVHSYIEMILYGRRWLRWKETVSFRSNKERSSKCAENEEEREQVIIKRNTTKESGNETIQEDAHYVIDSIVEQRPQQQNILFFHHTKLYLFDCRVIIVESCLTVTVFYLD